MFSSTLVRGIGAPTVGSFNGALATKRREKDIAKLLMSDYTVRFEAGTNASEFFVEFKGPRDTVYEGGVWTLNVLLPDEYPYKSPSIGFCNKIFHPNVDEASGTVCLDVINQTWSPVFDLINVFDVFLPQLLAYPNPKDPLNHIAAALLLGDPSGFAVRVKDYIRRYATPKGSAAMEVEKQCPSENHLKIEEEKSEDNLDTPLSNVSALSEISDLQMYEEQP